MTEPVFGAGLLLSHDLSGASSTVVMRELRPQPGRREGVLSDVEG